MASKKFYAYYIKGNKIALIEKDVSTSGSDLNAEDYGRYKSPKDSVTDGLEIEYTYVPNYNTLVTSRLQRNAFYINGWTVVSGYLTFVRCHQAEITNWSSSPYDQVGNDEHIYISGSNRWSGIHKVKSAGVTGLVQTYTKVNLSTPAISGSSDINIAAEGVEGSRISANNGSNKWLNNTFSAGDYIFVNNSGTAHNNGFWEIDSIQDSNAEESSSGVYIKNRYYCNITGDIDSEGIDTTPDTTADSNASIYVYKVYRDFCHLQANITALEDENFELDLPPYLCKAVVYYLKAKDAEFKGEIELFRYNITEFKRMMEKHKTAKHFGPKLIQGFWGMR